MTVFDFEWDPAKATLNRQKHDVSFEEAATIFLDPHMLSVVDEAHSGGEERWWTIGATATGKLLVVCHTFVVEAKELARIRIFSCRKATRTERAQYEA